MITRSAWDLDLEANRLNLEPFEVYVDGKLTALSRKNADSQRSSGAPDQQAIQLPRFDLSKAGRRRNRFRWWRRGRR